MIKLRQAQFSDYTAIAKLHADNWKINYRGILSDYFLDNEVDNDRLNTWHQRFSSPAENQFISVATLDDTIAGFCCVYLNDDPVFGSLIDNLHVSASRLKSGIGKMLIKESAEYICNHANNKKMYLWVYESNWNARIAYEKLGGTNFETIEKINHSGTISNTCRIIWDDASIFIQ
ncbi:MAG: GNAT family N-acetyltransferase [Sphingobacteriales bacterium]